MLFQGFLALDLIFASRELGLSAGQIGAAHMLGGSGALVSAIAPRHATRRFGMGAPILFGIFCSSVAWMLLAAVPRSDHAFLLMGASLFFFDFGVMLYWINYASLRQAVTPDAMLGRMTATMRFFTVAGAPLGAWCAGLAGERFGLRAPLFAVGAGVVAVSSALYAMSNLRRVPICPCLRTWPIRGPGRTRPRRHSVQCCIRTGEVPGTTLLSAEQNRLTSKLLLLPAKLSWNPSLTRTS